MKNLLAAILVVTLALPGWAETRVPGDAGEIALSFAPVVREAAPAVVNIYARRVVAQRVSPFAGNPFFEEFFRDFGPTTPRVQNSLGSGVILSPDGIVVSNYHVVGQAEEIRVVLNDRREFDARVLLGDEEADLAILKLDDADGLPALELRDSDSLEVGELVLAIGNPFGIGQTVSGGIVSGLARSGLFTGSARGYFIQTDAAINPGNSGGALVDTSGRLVGVNTAILTRSGGSMGIGFAIPANLVARFVEQAEAGVTSFQRPWAGITGQAVDAGLAEGFGLTRPEGVVISALHPASPYAAAGLQAGDVVVAIDGLPVNTPHEMLFRMSVAGIGGRLQVEYLRDGRSSSASVPMIAAPETPPRDVRRIGGRGPLAGLEVANINPAVIAEAGLPMTAEGVIVTAVSGYAARVGLKPGDILVEINGAPVAATADVARAARANAALWTVVLVRDGQQSVLRVRV